MARSDGPGHATGRDTAIPRGASVTVTSASICEVTSHSISHLAHRHLPEACARSVVTYTSADVEHSRHPRHHLPTRGRRDRTTDDARQTRPPRTACPTRRIRGSYYEGTRDTTLPARIASATWCALPRLSRKLSSPNEHSDDQQRDTSLADQSQASLCDRQRRPPIRSQHATLSAAHRAA